MGSPRDNFETFFSPGGDETNTPQPTPPPPEPKKPDPAELRTADGVGETQADTPAGTNAPDMPDPEDQEFGETRAVDVTAIKPSPALEAIRDELIRLEIVTAEQWGKASALSSNPSDLLAILDQLRTLPSHRRSRNATNPRVITAFQAEEIFEGREGKLRLGSYLIMDRLGAGGMGEVFKAWNLNLDRIEAIKVVTSNEVTGSTIGLARFEREARVLAQLDHPCITTIYNTGREQGIAYIAMEYVRGKTLLQVVKDAQAKNEKVPADWAVEVMREVASALEHAHSAGIIHRDIKPNNIMITDDGEVRVLDMGIARLLDPDSKSGSANLTRHVAGLGTPEVMPPEQWADASSVSPASDIYSLGCTFFFLLTGQMPFTGESMHSLMSAHLTEPPPSVRQLRKDVSVPVDQILRKMLAKEPRDRYASCADLLTDLNKAGSGPVTGRRRRPEVEQNDEKRSSPLLPVVSAIGILALVLAGIVGYWNFTRVDYAKMQAAYVKTYQAEHAAIWPTEDSIKTAATAAGVASVTNEKQLDEYKTWLEQRTDQVQKWRDEVKAEVATIQSKHDHIWRTRDELLARVNDQLPNVWSEDDKISLIASLKENTERVIGLHAKASAEVQETFEANREVIDEIAQLHEQANRSVPFASIKGDADIDTRMKAVNEFVRTRWHAKVDEVLMAEQAKAPDVWANVEAVRAVVGRSKLDAITSLSAIDDLKKSIEQQTWKKKATDWVLKFPEKHKGAWGSNSDKLMKFVAEKFPNDILDEKTYTEMTEAVNEETTKRLLPPWAKSYQAAHSDIWPDADDLLSKVMTDPSFDLTSTPTQEAFNKVANALTFQKVFKVDFSKGVEPTNEKEKLVLFRQTYFMDLLGLLLSLNNGGPKPTGKITMTYEVDGQHVDSIPLSTKDNPIPANFSMTSSIPGYVTFITFEAAGKVYAFQWEEPIKANQKVGLFTLDAAEKGVDRMLIFVTDVNLRSLLPKPEEGLLIVPTDVKDSRPQTLEGITMANPKITDPKTQPIIEFEAAEVEGIRSVLPNRDMLGVLFKQLEDGTAPDYIPPVQEVKKWGMLETKVRWGE